jgi:hypothetical protein
MQAEYLLRLRNMLKRNVTLPYQLICFTNKNLDIEGITFKNLPAHYIELTRNFTKFYIYDPQNGLSGRVVLLDLDIVLLGNIDEMLSYNGDWCGVGPFGNNVNYLSGQMISFNMEKSGYIYDTIQKKISRFEKSYLGRERFANLEIIKNPDTWQHVYPGKLVSFKKDCRKGIPDTATFLAFHGRPRPHECNNKRVISAWV